MYRFGSAAPAQLVCMAADVISLPGVTGAKADPVIKSIPAPGPAPLKSVQKAAARAPLATAGAPSRPSDLQQPQPPAATGPSNLRTKAAIHGRASEAQGSHHTVASAATCPAESSKAAARTAAKAARKERRAERWLRLKWITGAVFALILS